jgi:hypothetical protein
VASSLLLRSGLRQRQIDFTFSLYERDGHWLVSGWFLLQNLQEKLVCSIQNLDLRVMKMCCVSYHLFWCAELFHTVL